MKKIKLLAIFLVFFYSGLFGNKLRALELPVRIDFDNYENNTMTNYTGFNPLVYTVEREYGWNDTVSAYRYWAYDFKFLTCDKHYSDQDRIFIVDIPNGEYTVKLYFTGYLPGSVYADDIQVTSEGILVLDDIDATPYPNIKTFDTIITDNQLNLLFHDNGGESDQWMVDGIEIHNKIIKPEVAGISNSYLVEGETIIISGSNFGTKGSAAPLKWDNFESGTDGNPIDELTDWSCIATGEEHKPTYRSGSLNRWGSILCSENKMGPGDYSVRNSRLQWQTGANTEYIFLSFWTKFNWGRNIVDDDTSYQLKFWRICKTMSDWSQHVGCFNWQYNQGLPNESVSHYFNLRTGDGGGFTDYFSPAIEENVWFKIDVQVKQSDINIANGGFNVWQSRTTGPIINVASNWDVVTRAITERMQAFSFGEWLGNLIDGETETYFDDIYIDNTWARVEIGDAPNWENCTHREVQIPTNWNNDSIIVTINTGSFQNEETVYVFVIDKNGTVCSEGSPATIKQSLFILGDINDDGKVNIQDLQLCINVILGAEIDSEIVSRAKKVVAPDEECNELDLQGIVNIILAR